MFAAVARLIGRWERRRRPQAVEVLVDDDGVGVVLHDGSALPRFRWAEVAEIRTFKLDLGTVDDIRLQFRTADSWEEFSEDLRGFGCLSDKMMEQFPEIPRDWYMAVMQPPFATNERVLFRCHEARDDRRESPAPSRESRE